MNLTKGHNNLTKLNEIASCICGWFAMRSTYGFGQEFQIIEELYYIFVFSKIKYSRYQVSHKRRSQQLHLTISQLTTQIWIMFFRYPQVLSLRFELSSQQTQNQVEHKVVTKHMKEINRATIHHLNKENLHHAYYTYRKNIFGVF